MAQRLNLKPFYFVLGAIAVVGAGAIWMARGQSGSGAVEIGPMTVGTDAAFDGYVLGADSAAVEFIEYADFECPVCATFAILQGPDVKRRLVATGRVRWIFRDFPLPIHRHARTAHHAAACAGEQGRFWELHDQLYLNHGRWVNDRRPARVIERLARAVGLDMGRYEECMDADRFAARIEATRRQGAQMGVNATPTFVIGGVLIAGNMPFESLLKYVERAEARRER